MAADLSKYADLLGDKKAFANLATLMPDGSPQSVPVSCPFLRPSLQVPGASSSLTSNQRAARVSRTPAVTE